ncbi:MAG: bifunctional sugar-1-phosphate nucleotidylyltransferase/acetyltransferase [Dehalococcoidales bacterium]|nr:bifunctional sugar-1-phosphate nucleotidylyltransferase/acetyltransferase [Dehalococcoidales bacterium]
MKAVILAAGEGNRMRPLTYTRPKVMIPVANKPIAEHSLVEVAKAGIKEFIFIVGYHDEQLRAYFGSGDRWGVSVDYVTQRKQGGTADAVRVVEGLVKENFLVINGDVIVGHEEIAALMGGNGITMSLVEVADTRDLGTVELSGDRVVRIHEKVPNPPSNLANAGLYLFTPEIFAAIARTPKSPRGEYELTAAIQLLIDGGHPVYCQQISHWIDLSYPWDLLCANQTLLSGMEARNLGMVEKNVVIKGSVSIGSGTVVRSGSYIVGPVMIGQDCDIGPNCYIRPHTAIGDGCHVGAAVEVKNSIIMNGSKAPHHNYVGDSIIGEGCNLGAGTKIANLKLDESDIWVAGKNTGRRKLGAIMGDRVETGINACINVGTMIGNGTHIGPGAVAHGVISPNSKVF